MVERDLVAHEAQGLPTDWRFAIAYSAALKLATVVVRAEGYRTVGGGHHFVTFAAFGAIMGTAEQGRVQYLQSCRVKRNRAAYDRAGEVTEADVEDLVSEAHALKELVIAWLRQHHPALLPGVWT
ncbi:MAG: hypothetical protein U9R79_13130 [Armatimonadota bacterium]|nr:hypothetical protein [Armatimonadota bacterium]